MGKHGLGRYHVTKCLSYTILHSPQCHRIRLFVFIEPPPSIYKYPVAKNATTRRGWLSFIWSRTLTEYLFLSICQFLSRLALFQLAASLLPEVDEKVRYNSLQILRSNRTTVWFTFAIAIKIPRFSRTRICLSLGSLTVRCTVNSPQQIRPRQIRPSKLAPEQIRPRICWGELSCNLTGLHYIKAKGQMILKD